MTAFVGVRRRRHRTLTCSTVRGQVEAWWTRTGEVSGGVGAGLVTVVCPVGALVYVCRIQRVVKSCHSTLNGSVLAGVNLLYVVSALHEQLHFEIMILIIK